MKHLKRFNEEFYGPNDAFSKKYPKLDIERAERLIDNVKTDGLLEYFITVIADTSKATLDRKSPNYEQRVEKSNQILRSNVKGSGVSSPAFSFLMEYFQELSMVDKAELLGMCVDMCD